MIDFFVNPMAMLRNPKHELFARYLAEGSNKSEAARKAGYSEKSAGSFGHALAHKPHIEARTNELRQRADALVTQEVALSKEWILLKLVQIVDRALPPDGKPMQGSVANKALELLGKELGMFRDTIPREIFEIMMSQMGHIVSLHVTDASALEQIINGWERVQSAEVRQLRMGILPDAKSTTVDSDSQSADGETPEPDAQVPDESTDEQW